MSVLMAGKVLAKLCALLGFGSELQLDKFFNRLWAFIKSFSTFKSVINRLPPAVG